MTWKPFDLWLMFVLIGTFVFLCFMYSSAPSEIEEAKEFKRTFENPVEDLLDNCDGWEEVEE